MICEIRDNEVVLRHPTLGDVFALLSLMIHKDREIAFTKPEEEDE